MNRTLLKRSIDESKWLLFWCSLAIFWFCWIRVWLVSQLLSGDFQEILESLPIDIERFIAVDFAWLVTYPGRIAMTYDELVVVLCICVWAISRGSDCVSGEVGRGTMEMLLAQPVSRLQVLLTNAAVTIVGLVVLAGIAWLGIYVGIYTFSTTEYVTPAWSFLGYEIPNYLAEKEEHVVSVASKVSPSLFIHASITLFALGLMIAGFTTLMSSWDRYRWRTIGLVVGVFIVQVIIKLIGLAAEQTEWMLYLSVLTAYEPEAVVRVVDQSPGQAWSIFFYEAGVYKSLAPLGYHLILATVGIVSYLFASIIFCRRDLPAPL